MFPPKRKIQWLASNPHADGKSFTAKNSIATFSLTEVIGEYKKKKTTNTNYKMAPYKLNGIKQVFVSPKIRKRFEETLITPLMCNQARTTTSDKVCANALA